MFYKFCNHSRNNFYNIGDILSPQTQKRGQTLKGGYQVKNKDKARSIAKEAARILKDYPHLKYYEAIEKAKEVLRHEK